MSETNPAWVYEKLFVPAEFAAWPPRMVAAAEIARGDHVVDVACGTGILARHAADVVGSYGHVVAIDPSPNMLAVAAAIAPGIDWREGTAEALPFPDDSFDAVVSQFGLMFFTDRIGGLREMRRVLKPGGRMAIAVWDTLENTPAYQTLVTLLDDIVGPESAEALRAPFSLGDRDKLSQVIGTAGLDGAVITTHEGTGYFTDIRTFVECQVTGLRAMAIHVSDNDIERLVGETERRLARYAGPDGMSFESPAHIVRWQKPLT